MKPRKPRIFCEDLSPLYNTVKKEKYNGVQVILNGVSYTRIGNLHVLNHKTNKIEVYDTNN